MFDWPSKTANLDQLGSLRCHECADKNICAECLSSMILSPPNGYVKMSPHEPGDIHFEPKRTTPRRGAGRLRQGGTGVCQSRRTDGCEPATSQTSETALPLRR